jgi:hypothetical protein
LVAGVFTAVTTTPITAYADRDYKKDKHDKKDMKDHYDDDGYDKDSSDVSKTITKQSSNKRMLVVEIQTTVTVDKAQLRA